MPYRRRAAAFRETATSTMVQHCPSFFDWLYGGRSSAAGGRASRRAVPTAEPGYSAGPLGVARAGLRTYWVTTNVHRLLATSPRGFVELVIGRTA